MQDILDTVLVRDFVDSLPACERQLARMLMAGHTTQSAARRLCISDRAALHRLAVIRHLFTAA